MRREYHKLVRDRIPEIIEREGKAYEVRTLDVLAYQASLRSKIIEEAQEVAEAGEKELMKEIADLCEVLDALVVAYGVEPAEVRKTQARRRAERGGFENRIELLWVESPASAS